MGRRKKSNFMGFSGTKLGKKWPNLWKIHGNFTGQILLKMISKTWKFPGQILLESNWICTDLASVLH